MPRGILGDAYNAKSNPDIYKVISRLYSIPDTRARILPPQLIVIGSEDRLIKPSLTEEYYAKLEQAGHPAQYWVHEGRGHAFLDSGSSFILGTSFEQDAPEALNIMINFLNHIFYP
jgi:acetyl esterase